MTSASTAQSASPDQPAEPAGNAGTDPGPVEGGVPATIRRRLATVEAGLDARSWLATAVVVVIAAVLRFANLSHPPGKIFDEVY
ncbi:phospholipid carrier-dependent glycosyltransferase, partial [Escherichia coli]|nr:phospholipid carrier-dependent glycosyltransferase [Escherichia coli]